MCKRTVFCFFSTVQSKAKRGVYLPKHPESITRHTIVLASLTFLRLGRFVPHAKALDWFFHPGMFCHQTSCDWFLLIFQLRCQPFSEFCTHSCPQHPVLFVFPSESLALPLIVGECTAHVSTPGGALEPDGSSNTTLDLH